MQRIIRPVQQDELTTSLDFVERVFTQSEDEESGKLVRRLLQEIRSKKYYLPQLDLVMVNEQKEIVGQAIFARFHLDGKYEHEMLLLHIVSVKTKLQRQHISKDLIEHGLAKAKQMGYKFCVVEGNPQNYRSRGFVTSAPFGITAHESVGLPAPECLMVQPLVPNGLDGVSGQLSYQFYEALR